MVKQLSGLKLLIFLLSILIFFITCSNDITGLFVSSDLDERLKAKDIFNFLVNADLNPNFGSEYSFIVVTDTHIEDGNTFGLEKLAAVISKENTGFVVFLGDITQYGAEHDISKFINITKTFAIPCYPVIGNHDVYFGNWPVWKEKIGSTSYRVSWSGTTLFMLDSANAFFGKKQLDWLENELKTVNKSDHVFVFTHAPLFVTGPADMQQIIDTKERARIASILKDRCDIMFMGHLHKRLFNEAGNVKYQGVEDFKSTKTYCHVKVSSSGVTYKFNNL